MDPGCLKHSLTAQERDAFNNDGYLLVRKALTQDHAGELLAVLDRLHEENRLVGPQTYAGVTNRVQHLDSIGLDQAFVDLIDHPVTFPKVWGILGWNIYLYHSHLILTPPQPAEGPSGPTGWHQDAGRVTVDMPELEIPARLSLKVGYFLTDVPQPNMGNFWIIPGSHHRRGIGIAPGVGGILPGAEPICAAAGDALIFDRRLWHSGSPNYSRTTRKMLFYGYGYRWLRPYNGCPPPGVYTLSTVNPIRRQLLGNAPSNNGPYSQSDEDVPLRAWLAEHQPEIAAAYEY